MKNKLSFRFGVIALSLVLIACSGGSAEAGCPEIDGREINVVATTPMIGEFVSQVGGDNINLTVLMPPEADPHTYEPAPQDAGKIADADLVFYTGLMYEPAPLIELLENSVCGAAALAEVGESVFPIEFKEGGHDDHHGEKGHDDHDEEGHDDHDEEGHDDHDEHSEIIVPQSTPETLQVIRHELSEKAELHFTTEVETEIHIHGYDIHFMVYPDQENVLTIELSIAGEFEIEDHNSGVEFARLVVSP